MAGIKQVKVELGTARVNSIYHAAYSPLITILLIAYVVPGLLRPICVGCVYSHRHGYMRMNSEFLIL